MISLCNFCMEHSSNSFGTIRFNPDSASVPSKVSRAIGKSRTFEFFIIHPTNFCLNALPPFLIWTMYGLINHFTSVLCTWEIKCPRFVEAFYPWQYSLDILHWSKSLTAWTSFWSSFFDGDYTMDTILDMINKFCLLFFLFITDWCCMGQYCFFCSCRVIALA